jgi:hypothetical protein
MAFEDYIAQRKAELEATQPQDTLDASLRVAVEQDPDKAAAQHEITSRSGIVNPDVEEWKKQERLSQIRSGNYGPQLSRLLRDTQTAAIVQDDVDNLDATERALDPGSIQGQLESSGKILKDMGKAAYSGVLRASTGLQGILEAGIDTVEDVTGLDVPGADYLKAQRQFGQKRAQELMPNTDNALANAIYSGISSSVQNLITIAGTQGRGTLAAMSSMVAGESYTTGKDQGMSTTGAQLFGLTDGIVEALTEKLPLDALFKSIKGGGGFWKSLGQQFALEVPTEQVATVMQDFNAWAMLPENADKPFQSYLDERPRAAFDTLIATLTGTALTTTVTVGPGAVKNAFDRRKMKEDLAIFDGILAENERMQTSVAEQKRLDTLVTLAQESKTSERAAQVYKDFLTGASNEQSVYVPSDVIDDLAAQGVEMPASLATDGLGGDVEIPMDVFMTEVARNDQLLSALRPHLKMGLDQLSSSEIENGPGDTVRRLLERAKIDAEIKTETDRIWKQVQDQIVETGVMSAREARLSAQIIPAMVATTAQRRGLTPEQVFQAMNFTVQKPGQTAPMGNVMEQARETGYEGQDRGEAQQWLAGIEKYGPEGMTTEARLARAKAMGFDTDTVWYHGTETGGFASFDPYSVGENSGNASHGFYFTESPQNAATYSGTRPGVAVRVQENVGDIDEDGYEVELDPEPGIYEVFINTGNMLELDFEGRNWDGMDENGDYTGEMSVPEAEQLAIDNGYDSVLISNVSDEGPHGQGYHWGNKTLIVFDPKNIRSVNATFDDPDSANILAQQQVRQDKRIDVMEKLLGCVRAAA